MNIFALYLYERVNTDNPEVLSNERLEQRKNSTLTRHSMNHVKYGDTIELIACKTGRHSPKTKGREAKSYCNLKTAHSAL